MDRNEKIRKLYEEIYIEDNNVNISIYQMEEELKDYYSVAGVDIKSIDDVFENSELDSKFVMEMEAKIEDSLKKIK
ncbi:hypothetical protein [Clostridium sp.]|uniref:hypothetical protein n=1 Tax=Clostridium sp. TaxID=1506 RepID=UPI003F2F6F11